MSKRYSPEQVERCVRILGESARYEDALTRIRVYVAPGIDSSMLAKLFRRHGLRNPGQYLGGAAIEVPVDWDDGEEQTAQHAKRSGRLETVIAVPDFHAPFHDELAVSTCVEAVREMRPDHLVFLGDGVDSYDISDFPRDPARKHKYKEEVASANEVLDRFDRLRVPDVRYCEGNHDQRLARFIAKRAPELYGMLDISEELRMRERRWQWIPYGEVTTIGRFRFSHEFGSCGKYAAAQALAGVRHCIVFGHTHRAQCEYGGLADGERHVAWSAGWLGDYEALAFSYKKKWQARREWTHGFMWITLDETGCGWAQFVPILEGRCVVDGHVISGRKEAA